MAIQRSGAQLRDAFKIRDFDTKSTISWALEKFLERRNVFVRNMAENKLPNCLVCTKTGVPGMCDLF